MKKNYKTALRRLLLSFIVPGLFRELNSLLLEKGKIDLIKQLENLAIIGRCQCGDEFCSSIFVKYIGDEKVIGLSNHKERISLDPANGDIIISINSHGKIDFIEILHRPEYKKNFSFL